MAAETAEAMKTQVQESGVLEKVARIEAVASERASGSARDGSASASCGNGTRTARARSR
jgi:diaminopimelate epimerase